MRSVSLLLLSGLLCLPLAGPPGVRSADDPPKPAPLADVTPPKLRIGGELTVAPYRIVRLEAQGLPEKAGRVWKIKPVGNAAAVVDWATGRNVLKPEWIAPPGRYTVTLTVAWTDKDGQLQLDEAEAVVTIGDPGPAPVPPGPTPPPQPTPPQPATAFRVIFVRESGAPVPAWLNSEDVAAYLNRKCVKGADGRPEWRVYDPQQVLTAKESPTIKALWEATRPQLGQLPQVVISPSPEASQLHALPADAAAALALLKKYGGE